MYMEVDVSFGSALPHIRLLHLEKISRQLVVAPLFTHWQLISIVLPAVLFVFSQQKGKAAHFKKQGDKKAGGAGAAVRLLAVPDVEPASWSWPRGCRSCCPGLVRLLLHPQGTAGCGRCSSR